MQRDRRSVWTPRTARQGTQHVPICCYFRGQGDIVGRAWTGVWFRSKGYCGGCGIPGDLEQCNARRSKRHAIRQRHFITFSLCRTAPETGSRDDSIPFGPSYTRPGLRHDFPYRLLHHFYGSRPSFRRLRHHRSNALQPSLPTLLTRVRAVRRIASTATGRSTSSWENVGSLRFCQSSVPVQVKWTGAYLSGRSRKPARDRSHGKGRACLGADETGRKGR